MKKTIILLILLFINGEILPQKIVTLETGRISLSIKYPPPDTVAPILKLFSPVPNIISSLPIYARSPLITFDGKCIEQTKDSVFISINDSALGYFNKNKIHFKYDLKLGKHDYVISTKDLKGNIADTIITISYEPFGDFTPPEIYILDSVTTRGLNIVKIGQQQDIPYQQEDYINGVLNDSSGIYGLWINGEKVELDTNYSFSYHCKPDVSVYKLRAIDNRGNVATKLVEIKHEPEKIVIRRKKHSYTPELPFKVTEKNYYALIIGIQDYDDMNIPTLDHPIEDATKLAETLRDYYMFAPENIYLMKNPTRKEIIRKLKELRESLTDKDNLLVFYAGHGYWDNELQQGFWLPRDASLEDDSQWLSNGRIRDYIRGIKTKHTLLIADACFSGGIFKSREVKLEAPLSVVEMYKAVS